MNFEEMKNACIVKVLEDVRAEIEALYGGNLCAKLHNCDKDVLDIIDRKIAEAKGDKPFRYAKEIIEAQSPLSEGVNGEEFEKWLREGDKE